MTVLAQYLAPWNVGGASVAVTVGATPAADSTVFMAILFDNPTAAFVTGVAGLGATWEQVYNSPYYKVWRGRGATSSGSATATFSGGRGANAQLWVVDGDVDIIRIGQINTTGTSVAGPSQSAGAGQDVLTSAAPFGSITGWPTTPTPATGWTSAVSGPYSGVAYRSPTTTEAHQLTLTCTSGGNHSAVGQMVVGPITGPLVAQHAGGYNTGSPATITGLLDTVAGDVVYVAVYSRNSTVRTVSSITGLGATWSATNVNGAGRGKLWKGIGATTSGNVVVNMSGGGAVSAAAFVVRGLNDHTVVQGATRLLGNVVTEHLGPLIQARAGQVVLAIAMGDLAITWPSASAPATDWTTATHNSICGYGFRVPTAEADHQLTFTQAASSTNTTGVAEFVIGDGGDYASHLAKLNPLHWWRFDDPSPSLNYLDHASGGGTLATSAGATYRVPGAFAGDSNTATVGSGQTSVDPDPWRSMSGWFKYSAAPSSNTYDVMGAWFNGNGITYAGVEMETTGKLTAQPGGTSSPLSYADSQWHMLTWTYNDTDTKSRLYVDAELVLTGPAAVMPTSQNRFTVGHGAAVTDDTAVWTRELSQAEITAMYEAGVGAPPASGPVWWDGDSAEPAELMGWWDGDSIEPVELLGQWNGSAIESIEPLP